LLKKQADLPQLKQNLLFYKKSLEKSIKGTTNYDSILQKVEYFQNKVEGMENELQLVISNNIQFSSKYDNRQAVILYFEDNRLAEIFEAETA